MKSKIRWDGEEPHKLELKVCGTCKYWEARFAYVDHGTNKPTGVFDHSDGNCQLKPQKLFKVNGRIEERYPEREACDFCSKYEPDQWVGQ